MRTDVNTKQENKIMRDKLIEFGGRRSAINSMTCDRAPELLAAGSSLGIAVFNHPRTKHIEFQSRKIEPDMFRMGKT